MTLNVTVKNRIATYVSDQGAPVPVCGNSGDQVKFTFDEEWSQHEAKTARFKWGGKVFDQEFTGNICEIPNIDNTGSITVGVFVGEEENGEDELSTTDARIPYRRSTRCGKNVPHSDSGENYTNLAKGYAVSAAASATEAAEAAEEAKEAAENAGGGGMTEIGSVTITLTNQGTDGANFISADGNAELWALAYTAEPKFVKIKNNGTHETSALFGCAQCYADYGSSDAQRALDFAAIEAVSEEDLPWQRIHFSDVVKGLINDGVHNGEGYTVTFTFYA